MVSTGKAGSVEMALQGHGNIHGSAVSRQVLPCMWTITWTICGFVEHPYLWVYIVRIPQPRGVKLSKECHVNDYLSVMKTLCIRLYRRTVETETKMNSFVYIYIRIMVKYIFTNIYIIGHVFDKHKSFNCNSTFAVIH